MPQGERDPNSNAARIVREATTRAADDTLPNDVEAAWGAWISHIQNIDERTKTLLRAAFEAGYDAKR